MKKSILFSLLFGIFAVVPCFAATMGQIAIFTESVGWTDVGTANNAAQMIIDEVNVSKDIKILGDKDIAAFAEANTDDGQLDVIILFGYFPVNLYAPGNGEADDSIGELFLEGGNMILNTADYIFYVTQGGGANGDTGLKNMTDSNFDMWTDGNVNEPTADGEKYTPSYQGHTAPRSFKVSQIEGNDEWELEVAFGMDGGESNADPAIIRNVDYDGRVGIVMQVSAVTPKGEVFTEILNNWLPTVVKPDPVEPLEKLPVTWGDVKNSF